MYLYKTVMKRGEAEQTIDRSRFIGHACPVTNKGEAEAFFSDIRTLHRSATHNVPAFVIGDKFQQQWASDDGEPQGTSGAPIVQMMVKEELTDVAVVVTRYYGGIKLGTGGLVRAYTSSAKLALQAAQICQVREQDLVTFKMDYTYHGKVINLSESGLFTIGDTQFTDKVTVTLAADPEHMEEVKGTVINLTSGTAELVEDARELVKIPE